MNGNLQLLCGVCAACRLADIWQVRTTRRGQRDKTQEQENESVCAGTSGIRAAIFIFSQTFDRTH
jgi:hypothetical protein